SATSQNGKSEFASANDTGPVNVITEDPTCEAWSVVGNTLVDEEKKVNWGNRDASVPVTSWTPEQKAMFETVGRAFRTAADKSVNLTKKTPHRVMRELYEQFIVYSREFSDKISSYDPRDDDLAKVADGIGSVLANICGSIVYGSALKQGPLVPSPERPTEAAPVSDIADVRPMLKQESGICAQWAARMKQFFADTAAWQALDVNVSEKDWSPDQRAINEQVAPVMTTFASDIEALGRSSGNSVVEDFAVLSAQYRRAFVQALPSYTPADNYLANVATYMALTVDQACAAAA
ncbi:hypothetical protein, partial [Mycolicibacterium sp.]|uniref:hypothetical protein n=1 Tax=Mycolicibacterium sp. TaxID=2320850 RepID=UPI0037C7CA3F